MRQMRAGKGKAPSLGGLLIGTLLLAFGAAAAPVSAEAARPITVASKNFPESYILAEAMAQLLEREGFAVVRRLGLGGTLICYQALVNGEIDVYPEYTGTIAEAILKLSRADAAGMGPALRAAGIEPLPALGFNNTYALAVPGQLAAERGLARISDLKHHADLRLTFSHEFLERDDGWPGLSRAYGLDLSVTGIEHGLAYQAIADGSIDGTDVYSTDGELMRYSLAVLEDDQGFFPRYLALPLVRADVDARAKFALTRLAGTIDDASMRAMNAAAVFEGESFAAIAGGFLGDAGLTETRSEGAADTTAEQPETDLERLAKEMLDNTLRHLELTAIALSSATAIALVAAFAIFRVGWLSKAVVYVAGLLQTVPSIALLALMIPVAGIGWLPAVLALLLYSILPILRNAVTALTTVDPLLLEVAKAMGLTPAQELRYIHLPLSVPAILAGIRTAAVICIGTATLAAFIGAGGLGDPIVTGLALNDTGKILEGAVPAALLAIVTELVFEAIERRLAPAHLRV
ncbi:MAG: ABC transporter permease subunit [Gammaproteobacteria bacterium]|nr:ABC transporter permease subunit [Gammaproteobacteria bacterium]MYB39467.1 ABC transporter permease subunit [Gammaproteobacteria bacterium]